MVARHKVKSVNHVTLICTSPRILPRKVDEFQSHSSTRNSAVGDCRSAALCLSGAIDFTGLRTLVARLAMGTLVLGQSRRTGPFADFRPIDHSCVRGDVHPAMEWRPLP